MSQYTRLASTDEQERAVEKVEAWVKSLKKTLMGGTVIGKHPQSVIMDLTYQGGEIHVSSDGEITVNSVEVDSYEDFKEALHE